MNLSKYFVVSVLVLNFMAGLVFSQENETTEVAVLPNVADIPDTAPGNVTLDFKEADITNILRILSYKSGINIVAGKDVTGPVTIRLTDVHWEKALDVILRTYGFTYEKIGENIIRVTTTEDLEKEELITEVFSLNYADAGSIPNAIEDMLSERGSVKFDERVNLVIVTDIPTNVYKIRQVIEKLDQRTMQVSIETKIVETTLDKDDKLGIDWSMIVRASGSQRPITAPLSSKQSGGNWYPRGDTSASAGTNTGVFSPGPGSSFPLALPTNFTFGTLDFTSLQAILRVLKTRTDTKIVSNPRIVTLNNQEATIHVGETLYIPEFTESTVTGLPSLTGLTETLKTGVKLKVTPHVNTKGEIVVDIEPEVSTRNPEFELLEGVDVIPVSIRTAKAQVMIKDGETIVIGGLVKEEQTDVVVKVPILGDIPFLSLLFKSKIKTVDTTDLIFFVTVSIVDSEKKATASVK